MRPAPGMGRSPGHAGQLDGQLAAARRAGDRLAQQALARQRMRHVLEQRRLARARRRTLAT